MWEVSPLWRKPHCLPCAHLPPTLPTPSPCTLDNDRQWEAHHLDWTFAEDRSDFPSSPKHSPLPRFYQQLRSHHLDFFFLPRLVESTWSPLIDLSLESNEAQSIWYRETWYAKSKVLGISKKVIVIFPLISHFLGFVLTHWTGFPSCYFI